MPNMFILSMLQWLHILKKNQKIKRGYALKEKSKGKKNELVKKERKWTPKKRPRKCANPKCHYYPIFSKKFNVHS